MPGSPQVPAYTVGVGLFEGGWLGCTACPAQNCVLWIFLAALCFIFRMRDDNPYLMLDEDAGAWARAQYSRQSMHSTAQRAVASCVLRTPPAWRAQM